MNFSEEWKKYTEDSRIVCKYASKCYQKNEEHKKRFKHPPKRGDKFDQSPAPKKMKIVGTPFDNQELSSAADAEVSNNNKIKERRSVTPEKKSPLKLASKTEDKISDKNILAATTSSAQSNGYHDVPDDIPRFIKQHFLVDMPKDFYSFWEFCCSLSTTNTREVLKATNLMLVGPFDVLSGKLPKSCNKSDYLLHWRYYYDPPEFQTILMSPGGAGFHLGYYRDSPSAVPCFVASNEAQKSCKITACAENIFGAVLFYLENAKKKSPFISVACQKIITPLKAWADKYKFTVDTNTQHMKSRQKTVVSRTFHSAGIVVPHDKKTDVGYRPLMEKDDKIKQLISLADDAKKDGDEISLKNALTALQPIITMANIATDECDFGTGLELGIDFFCAGSTVLDSSAKRLLCTAYNMLNREEFAQITEAHFDNRRRGLQLSMADL